MGGLMGFWVGGFVGLFLVSALVLLFFGKNKWSYKTVTISAICAYAIATILGGYGMADGGPPQFANTLILCFVPFLAVLAINLLRVKRKLDKIEQELAAELERQEDS